MCHIAISGSPQSPPAHNRCNGYNHEEEKQKNNNATTKKQGFESTEMDLSNKSNGVEPPDTDKTGIKDNWKIGNHLLKKEDLEDLKDSGGIGKELDVASVKILVELRKNLMLLHQCSRILYLYLMPLLRFCNK